MEIEFHELISSNVTVIGRGDLDGLNLKVQPPVTLFVTAGDLLFQMGKKGSFFLDERYDSAGAEGDIQTVGGELFTDILGEDFVLFDSIGNL